MTRRCMALPCVRRTLVLALLPALWCYHASAGRFILNVPAEEQVRDYDDDVAVDTERTAIATDLSEALQRLPPPGAPLLRDGSAATIIAAPQPLSILPYSDPSLRLLPMGDYILDQLMPAAVHLLRRSVRVRP